MPVPPQICLFDALKGDPQLTAATSFAIEPSRDSEISLAGRCPRATPLTRVRFATKRVADRSFFFGLK